MTIQYISRWTKPRRDRTPQNAQSYSVKTVRPELIIFLIFKVFFLFTFLHHFFNHNKSSNFILRHPPQTGSLRSNPACRHVLLGLLSVRRRSLQLGLVARI